MPIALLLGGKRLLLAALGWLRSLSWSQLLCLALAGLALLFYLQRNDARHDADSYKRQRDYYVGELKRITTAKDEQRGVTDKNIAKAKDRIVIVERDAKRVEAAPLPGQCRTPDAIMNADI